MKQVEQNYRTGVLRVVETPAPLAPRGGVLVATRASLISAGTERQIIDLAKASLAGKAMARPDLVRRTLDAARREGVAQTVRKVFARLDTPIPLGYSAAGVVIEAGEGARGFAPGARVACAGAGVANHAEFNAVPQTLCVRIPDAVSDADAAFVTLGAIALQGVRVAAPQLGERIAVIGLGLIGLLTVQLLKANGCKVVGYDPNPARAALARELGADVAVSEGLAEAVRGASGGFGADAAIVTASSGSSAPLNSAAEICRLKGRVVVVGAVGMSLEREAFYRRELDLRFSMSYGPGRYDPSYEREGRDYPFAYVRWTEQRNMEAFLDLAASGAVTPAKLVTHRFAIAEAERAYALLESDEPHLAILLDYPEAAAPARLVTAAAATPARAEGPGVAFVGFGNYAKSVLMPAVKQAGGARLTVVATASGLSAQNAAEKHGFAAAASDARAAFEDADTNAVIIATRHDTHARLAAEALGAGKHVFVEKPLALTHEELSAVLAAARAAPGRLTVGFNRRFAPLLIAAKEALAPRSGPLVMLYRVNAGAAPADSWLNSSEGGGRVLGEVCHFVDALSFLAGAAPIEAQAIGARDAADSASVLLRFADGSSGAIVYSTLGDARAPKEYVEAFADGRMVQLDDFRRLASYAGGRRNVRSLRQDKGQAALVRAFLASVRGAGPAPIALAELAASSLATLAIAESLRCGAAVAIGQ